MNKRMNKKVKSLNVKNWRFWAGAILLLTALCGAAAADVFYTVVDSTYTNGSAGIAVKNGDKLEIMKDLLTGIGGGVYTSRFFDASGKERLMISNFAYDAADAVKIWDLNENDWSAPIFDSREWHASDVYGAVSLGEYLYVAAQVRDYVASDNQKSGEVIKVRMSDWKAVDRYAFENRGECRRHINGIKAYNGKIYTVANVTNFKDYEDSEVFEFDPDNISGGPARKADIGVNPGAMSKPLALYGNKLFVSCAGNTSSGGFWAVDLDAMTASQVLNLEEIKSLTGLDVAKAMGIAIADDGAALLLINDGATWAPSALYATSAAKLLSSAPALDKAGTKIDAPAEGYAFYAEYDSENSLFWVGRGQGLEARGKDGALIKSWTPAELGDNIYSIAVIRNKNVTTPPAGTEGSGGGCGVGFGAPLALLAAAALLLRRK
jgi:Synergist-CTERM protein sorting domain-containing protein